ncbi:DUF1905 domain-containing protein [bacterium]|nr:MAG: DUF1905 domain-containing protein [bacterium]
MVAIKEPITFEAKLLRPVEGGGWTFLRLPQEASDRLPSRSQVSVEGILNNFAFQATLQPDGQGGHWLKIDPSLSQGAKAQAGDVVALKLSPTTVEPEPEVPDDLQKALSETPAALAVWKDITPLARRDWIQWMTSGKKAETRGLRLEKMMDMLTKGKRRICCFDRSGMYSKSLSCPTAAQD